MSRNHDAQREMMEKSGQMKVLVLDINGRMIIGFDQNAINEALTG